MKPEDKVKVQQALEAMDSAWGYGTRRIDDKLITAITALRQLLEQPEPVQEPVAWMDASGDIYKHELWPDWNPPHKPLYTTPPAQPAAWVGLMDEEMVELFERYGHKTAALLDAHEAKLREKNGGAA